MCVLIVIVMMIVVEFMVKHTVMIYVESQNYQPEIHRESHFLNIIPLFVNIIVVLMSNIVLIIIAVAVHHLLSSL